MTRVGSKSSFMNVVKLVSPLPLLDPGASIVMKNGTSFGVAGQGLVLSLGIEGMETLQALNAYVDPHVVPGGLRDLGLVSV
ncbi:hypothetical protein Nepgr_001900 [Nepenthes gracilis]|uniref:Uncharacterized protein n=1 Tax=Nepenthes gracilis TaxID=150966 RepID=A0AAD3P5V4_NEPGR|nr:hypothetical protein Nepgr_001900 [Nepenthes gracilis]